jgi:hypothetical protein
MSLFFDVLAWVFIVIGTVSSALTLVTRSSDSARQVRAGPGARSGAWPKLRRSLFLVTAGMCLFAIQSRGYADQWLAATALTVVAAWDLGSWLKSRARRKSGSRMAEPS